jgi:hypothetical protein
MNEKDARDMKDHHSRDEARLRRQQQQDAGGDHAPVEPYPQHGARSGAPADALVADYESTLAGERSAWDSVKSATEGSDFDAAWSRWRDAVEERDRATRMLINQSLRGPASV